MNEYEGAIGLLWLILIIGLIGFISGRAKNFLKETKNDGWYIFWSSDSLESFFIICIYLDRFYDCRIFSSKWLKHRFSNFYLNGLTSAESIFYLGVIFFYFHGLGSLIFYRLIMHMTIMMMQR